MAPPTIVVGGKYKQVKSSDIRQQSLVFGYCPMLHQTYCVIQAVCFLSYQSAYLHLQSASST